MSQFSLILIVLIEGFLTISAEVLTIRQLLPVVGGSVIVTSFIIGFFLLFLAYGYKKGGEYTENYTEILKNNFLKSSFILTFGLSYLFIFLFFNLFEQYISTNLLIILIAYLLIVTAPLVYILGQTVPITMNLYKNVKRTGEIGGKILHLSTIGSFLGAIITTLILMNLFGVGWTVFINSCLLVSLSILLSNESNNKILDYTILTTIIFSSYYINVGFENNKFIAANNYANYEVITAELINTNPVKRGKLLAINNSASSFINEKNESFSYIELIKKVLFNDLKLNNKEILVLGAGGFTLSATGENNNNFTYIDIDKNIKQIVEQNFLNPVHGKFEAADARTYIKNHKKFDVIVSDAYSSTLSIPNHLVTVEYFNEINNSLNEDGLAILNIIANPMLKDKFSKRIDNTLRTAFSNCMSMPINYADKIDNIIYICQKNQNNNLYKENEIYSDNFNRSALDFFNLLKKYKKI